MKIWRRTKDSKNFQEKFKRVTQFQAKPENFQENIKKFREKLKTLSKTEKIQDNIKQPKKLQDDSKTRQNTLEIHPNLTDFTRTHETWRQRRHHHDSNHLLSDQFHRVRPVLRLSVHLPLAHHHRVQRDDQIGRPRVTSELVARLQRLAQRRELHELGGLVPASVDVLLEVRRHHLECHPLRGTWTSTSSARRRQFVAYRSRQDLVALRRCGRQHHPHAVEHLRELSEHVSARGQQGEAGRRLVT